MPLPKKICVGPFRYSVGTRHDAEQLGEGDTDKLRIHIATELPLDNERETLPHGVLHAVFAVTGLGHTLDDEDEERLVRTISPTLLDTLRRNKALRDYLFA